MFKFYFKKSKVPGPESEAEKYDTEVDKMIQSWYRGAGQNNNWSKFEKGPGWWPIIVMLAVFVLVIGLSAALIYKTLTGAIGSKNSQQTGEEQLILDLDVEVPHQVVSGDIIAISIIYKNVSNVVLTDINLSVLYPDNFIFLESQPAVPQNLAKNEWKLESLDPRTSKKLEIKGQIFGSKAERKDITATIIYKPTNFHSNFKKEVKADFVISESALNILVSAPDNLLKAQLVEYRVKVKNTSSLGLDGVVVRLSIPIDLTKQTSSVVLKDNIWTVGSLKSSEEQELLIRGEIKAQPGDLEEFRVEAGFIKSEQFLLQNQAVHIAAVIEPEVTIKVEQSELLVLPKWGETLNLKISINNLSNLLLENNVLDLKVQDSQSVLLWNSLRVAASKEQEVSEENIPQPAIKTEILDDKTKDRKTIQLIGLANIPPVTESNLTLSIGIIEVPYDVEEQSYAVDITPTLSAVSQDLSVPIEVAGEISNWVIK